MLLLKISLDLNLMMFCQVILRTIIYEVKPVPTISKAGMERIDCTAAQAMIFSEGEPELTSSMVEKTGILSTIVIQKKACQLIWRLALPRAAQQRVIPSSQSRTSMDQSLRTPSPAI